MVECIRCGSRAYVNLLICPVCQIGDEPADPAPAPFAEVKMSIREAVQDLANQGYRTSSIAAHVGIPEDLVEEILGV